MTNVIGLYEDPGKAQQVINELIQAGLQKNDVELMAQDEQELESHISELGIREEDAHLYAEAVRHGKAVVRAQTSEDNAEQILELLNRNGALDLDEVAQEFEQEEERQQPAKQAKPQQKQTISQAEESLTVEKRKTLQGGKRVTTKVSEQPVEQKIKLKEEKVDVRQEESDRKLSPEEAESAFKEETREFTETREVPEVKKEARETGRVEIEKSAKEREETVRDTVRKSEIKTEEIKPEGKKEK
ncbi:MAG: DUF2382 domain-containing protein [Rhodospirillaceae bacterium]|nr:DUF2382 domain-containing protein [Rhodospirillales bacterium]